MLIDENALKQLTLNCNLCFQIY